MFKTEYVLVTSLTSISTLFLSAFVYWKGRQRKLNIVYSCWALCVGLWGFFLVFNILASGQKMAVIWCHFLHFWAILLLPLYVHFVLLFLKKNETRRALILILYLISVICIGFNLTPWFLTAVYRQKFDFFVSKPLELYIVHLITFIGTVLYVYGELIHSLYHTTGIHRKQVMFFLIATASAYSGGVTNYLINYNYLIFPLYPYGNLGVLFYVGVVGIAIIRYKLLDIDVIIRKTVVFAGLLTFVFGVFTAATFLVTNVLSQFGANNLWTYFISLSLIVLGYDPIRNLLVNLTDRYLFQKKYDYQKLLKDASRGMSRIESLDHLMKLVVHFITMKMRVKNVGVLTRQNGSETFQLYHQRGYAKNYLDYRLDEKSPLITYLDHEKEALDIERIKELAEYGGKRKKPAKKGGRPSPDYDYPAIKAQMEELEAVCCVPSFLGHELRNVLILGEKKSGDFYTDEDLNVLFTLAQESAIAIENARLFDEAIAKTKELERINEQLEYSKELLIKALKDTEVANKQLQDTQAQLIHEQKMATLGRLAASVGHEVNNPLTILSMNVSRAILKYRKNPDTKGQEILELFDKMEQNIGRIKAVVNTLTGLLKRSEKGKFEPLSLKLILEETLPLVQFQTYLDNLTGTEVEFIVPSDLPLVRGDLERLQEVFLNLFINAYHAMEGRRDRRIRVTAEVDPKNPLMIDIHFTDNGSGMSEEVMKKAFTYGFTTKPPGRGSGMGLYMCKYIIELHGGDMHVASKLGEGTTFTLTLPIYEEAGTSASGVAHTA